MKLSKLREEHDSQDDFLTCVRSIERIKRAIKTYNDKFIFWNRLIIPEGELHVEIKTEFESTITDEHCKKKLKGSLGKIICKIDQVPKMDPKPVIPTNIMSLSVETFINGLKEADPTIVEIPRDILDMFDFQIQNITIYPGRGVFYLKVFLETPTWNIKVTSPRSLGELLSSNELIRNTYMLEPRELPTFTSDYTSTMNKLLDKSYKVYLALRKGTWKGHTYELNNYKIKEQGFIVHHNGNHYDKESKQISPEFRITASFGWETVDGKKNDPENSPLSDEERKEFREFLTDRFKKYGVEL